MKLLPHGAMPGMDKTNGIGEHTNNAARLAAAVTVMTANVAMAGTRG